MTTNIQLIGDALRLINVINEIETPSAEQGATALRVLNQMMEEWEECGIKVQYYAQTSTSVDFPCPAYTESAVTAALAIRLAPFFGASVSPELAAQYDIAYSSLLRKAMNAKLQPVDMSHLPLGEGTRTWDIETDAL